jgi:hypothetical protein
MKGKPDSERKRQTDCFEQRHDQSQYPCLLQVPQAVLAARENDFKLEVLGEVAVEIVFRDMTPYSLVDRNPPSTMEATR